MAWLAGGLPAAACLCHDAAPAVWGDRDDMGCFMVRDGDLVAIFHSIHRVMKAEKLLKAQGADMLLIPVPRKLSSDCGLAIRLGWSGAAAALEALAAENLRPQELYRADGKEFVPVPEEASVAAGFLLDSDRG